MKKPNVFQNIFHHFSKWTLVCFAMFAATWAYADWLELINGSKIKGEVVSVKDGVITFKGKYIGEITVPEKEASIITEKQEVVDAAGTAAAASSGSAVESGSVAAALADKTAPGAPVAPEESAKSEQEKQAEESFYFEKEVREAKEYFVSMLPKGWSGKLDVGFMLVSTNTQNTGLNVGFNAKKDVAPSHYQVSAFYNYLLQTETNGNRNKTLDKWGGSFIYRHDIPQIEWLYFEYRGSFLRDLVQNIDEQVQNSVGAGMKIIDEDDFKFTLTPAATAEYLNAPGVRTRWIGFATLSDAIEYHFTESFRVEQNASISVAPYNINFYQYKWSSSFITKLTEWIEASLSYQLNFTSLTGTGGSNREEIISLSLGVPF